MFNHRKMSLFSDKHFGPGTCSSTLMGLVFFNFLVVSFKCLCTLRESFYQEQSYQQWLSSAPAALTRDQKCINQHSGSVSFSSSCSEMVSVVWLCLSCPFYPRRISVFHIFLLARSMQQYQTVCKSTSTVENFLKQKESRERYIFLPMKTDKRGPERMIAAYYPANLII